MSMLRRFSTFKKGKGDKGEKADAESKKANGSSANGTTPTKDNSKRQSRVSAPPRRSSSDSGNSAESEDIPPVFEKYAQVLHASSRPVPHQGGEAAYLEKEHPSGLFNDLKSLGLKDYSSLKDVIKTKINGELTDDKTMIMERVIQVSSRDLEGYICAGFKTNRRLSAVSLQIRRCASTSRTYFLTSSGALCLTRRSRKSIRAIGYSRL